MNNVNQETINDLNQFLKGVHMGGTSFKEYKEKAQDPRLKQELTDTLEAFKRHEEAITHRISQLGGDAADSLGIGGTIADLFEKIKNLTLNTDHEVVEAGVRAMEMGAHAGKQFIREHSSLESTYLHEIQSIVDEYELHKQKMEELQREYTH